MSTSDEVKLCRDKIKLEGKVILGIHSNVAGDNYGYTSGHAWVSIETDTEMIYLGLWPDGHPRTVNKSPNCTDVRIGLEKGAAPMVSRYYELTAGQLSRLILLLTSPMSGSI